MVKTMDELRDELKTLREEMFDSAESADLKIVASWVDRLLIAVERLTESVELMDAMVDASCECCSMEAPKAVKKPAKKSAKKAEPKKAAKKRR